MYKYNLAQGFTMSSTKVIQLDNVIAMYSANYVSYRNASNAIKIDIDRADKCLTYLRSATIKNDNIEMIKRKVLELNAKKVQMSHKFKDLMLMMRKMRVLIKHAVDNNNSKVRLTDLSNTKDANSHFKYVFLLTKSLTYNLEVIDKLIERIRMELILFNFTNLQLYSIKKNHL